MDTIVIKTQAELDALVENNLCHIKGHLKLECYIEAAYSIKAGGYIKAAYSIKAGGYIESEYSIKAGGYIEAEYYIKAGDYIESGDYIEAGDYIFSFYFSITCKILKTRILPFWRNYYAAMPPLKKYAALILNESNCWDTLREKLKPEAVEICAWDGWHPHIKAQLEMFFELRSEVPGEEL